MTRFAPLLIAFVLAVVAAGGVLFGWSMGTQPPVDVPSPAASSSNTPSTSVPAPVTTPAPRAGRVLALDEAFKELDLIRPSREKIAEDFTLSLADGSTFRLADHRGRVVLINFWATWCPPCREEMPSLERLHRQHKAQGLVLVAVSLDADTALVPPYVKTAKLTFPIALDPKAETGNKYGVRALPSSFVVDRKGTLTALALGPRAWDNDAAHSLVEALIVDNARRAGATSRTP